MPTPSSRRGRASSSSPARMAPARPTCSRRSRCSRPGAASGARAWARWRGRTAPADLRWRPRSGEDVDIGTGTLAAAPERRQVRIDGAPASANSPLGMAVGALADPGHGPPVRRRRLGPAPLPRPARPRAAPRSRHPRRPLRSGDAGAQQIARRGRGPGTRPGLPRWRRGWPSMAPRSPRRAQPPSPRSASGSKPRPKARSPAPLIALGRRRARGDLAAARARDAAAGRTLAGPHRADLAVTHAGKAQPAALCSTGEQKALLIGLILAHADLVAERTGRRPILLLDEIAAHLDPSRRAALFERLAAGGRAGLDDRDRARFVRGDRRGDPLRARRGRLNRACRLASDPVHRPGPVRRHSDRSGRVK